MDISRGQASLLEVSLGHFTGYIHWQKYHMVLHKYKKKLNARRITGAFHWALLLAGVSWKYIIVRSITGMLHWVLSLAETSRNNIVILLGLCPTGCYALQYQIFHCVNITEILSCYEYIWVLSFECISQDLFSLAKISHNSIIVRGIIWEILL